MTPSLVKWPGEEPAPTRCRLACLPKPPARPGFAATERPRRRAEQDGRELKDEPGLGQFEGWGRQGFRQPVALSGIVCVGEAVPAPEPPGGARRRGPAPQAGPHGGRHRRQRGRRGAGPRALARRGKAGLRRRGLSRDGAAGDSRQSLWRTRWLATLKRRKPKAMAEGSRQELTRALERCKAQPRAAVEHPFHVVKCLCRHRKVRCRVPAKNAAQLYSLFALANLVLARRLEKLA